MAEVPEISVVIPLPDDRGHVLECLAGFTQQYFNVSREVIVPTDAAIPGEIASLVNQFPQLRWIHRPRIRVNALYSLGGEADRGKCVYSLESHCVPKRDCLQQIFDLVQQSGLPAACEAPVAVSIAIMWPNSNSESSKKTSTAG